MEYSRILLFLLSSGIRRQPLGNKIGFLSKELVEEADGTSKLLKIILRLRSTK